ncbi:MAG: translation elongation factor 4 [Patescibacteria group bacterium]
MLNQQNIRNFSIIAHIDHGKSTLADRMLEITKTVESRKMQEQLLDGMELERERGITIKMQPVLMNYKIGQEDYCLNLIDTPGHIDFSYEVSRALKAVEGVILLVDASQGIQAQTMSVLEMAQALDKKIIPVINKIDLPQAEPETVMLDVADLVGCNPEEVLAVSGKTGQGVEALLEKIIEKIPPPAPMSTSLFSGLVFDFEYSNHRGVILYVRVLSGEVTSGQELKMLIGQSKFSSSEVGVFLPTKKVQSSLISGQIGYIVTGLKDPGIARVGETVATTKSDKLKPVPGFQEPSPVVWASIYPTSQDDFDELKRALSRLRLSDSSLSFEEETSGALGRGFLCGFLGMLHLEIITERLRREFNLDLVTTAPSASFKVLDNKTKETEIVYAAFLLPEDTKRYQIFETMARAKIILPPEMVDDVLPIFYAYEAELIKVDNFGEKRNILEIIIPLRELMRGFFDNLKSKTAGFASLTYELEKNYRLSEAVKLEILVNDEPIPALTTVVSKRRVETEAQEIADRLKELIPRQMIVVKIQIKGGGRIIAARSLPALRKDVTGYLYGGDITRKMKLREKQKKGKKKMQKVGRVDIPSSVFMKMMTQRKSTGKE